MELWIRSQDKSDLINVKRLTYYFYNGEHHIFADDLKVILGIYKDKERALEVLDEIQCKIKSYKSEYNDSGMIFKEISVVVYDMPKE